MPPLRERQLVGFLDGTAKKPSAVMDIEVELEKGGKETQVVPNPAYATWVAQDQQVLGFLLSSLTRGVLIQVSSLEHSAEVWAALTAMYSSQSRAQVMQIRMQLASAQKGEKRVSEYFARMRSLGDAMMSAGKKMDDDDLTAYILAGLDAEWNPLVTSMTTRADPVPLSELYAHLLNFETRLDIQNGGAQGSGGSFSYGGGGLPGGAEVPPLSIWPPVVVAAQAIAVAVVEAAVDEATVDAATGTGAATSPTTLAAPTASSRSMPTATHVRSARCAANTGTRRSSAGSASTRTTPARRSRLDHRRPTESTPTGT